MKSDIEKAKEQQRFNKAIKKEQNKGILLSIQFILCVPLATFFIWSFWSDGVLIIAKINLILLLLVMAYNKKKYFQKNRASILYILTAALFLIDIIIGFIL